MAVPTLDQLLVYAAMAGDLKRVERRLAQGASTSYIDKDKGSALMQACHRGFLEVARRLLNAGANPNAVMEETGLSAVQYAAAGKYQEIVDLCCGGNGTTPAKPKVIPPQERYVPPLPVSTNLFCNLLQPFEMNCVFGCCGWDAFDFSADGVAAVNAHGVSLESIREDTLRAIALLRDLPQPVAVYGDVGIGREDIPLLQGLLKSVAEVEARGVKSEDV